MTVLMIATLLLPPLGLVLLWMRKDSGIGKKIFASFAILALSASYLIVAYNKGFFVLRDTSSESHYDELERQSSEQQQHRLPPPLLSALIQSQTPLPQRSPMLMNQKRVRLRPR